MRWPPSMNLVRTLLAACVTLAAGVGLGWQLFPEIPSAASIPTLVRAGKDHSEEKLVEAATPWLALLQQEGRYSAKVHAALKKIPEGEIPHAFDLLKKAALTAEDEAGAASILWRRLTLSNAEFAFELLCKMRKRNFADLTPINVFFATVARGGWPRTEQFLLRAKTNNDGSEALEAALPVLKISDPYHLEAALSLQRSLRNLPTPLSDSVPSNDPNELAAKQIDALAMTDPQGALDLFLALPEHARTENSLSRILAQWPEGGEAQLLELHQSLLKPELLTLVEQARTLRLAKTDLPAAVAWLDSLPEDRRQTAAHSIREQLLLGNPDAAQRLLKAGENWWIAGLTFAEPRGSIERFVQQQPDAARAWAESFPEGPLQTTARAAYLSVIARADAEAARQFALADKDPQRAAEVLGRLSLTPRELHNLVSPLPLELRQRVSEVLFDHFPSQYRQEWEANGRNYAPMLEFVQMEPGMQLGENFRGGIFQTAMAAVQTKPIETMDWIQRQPEAIAAPIFSRAFEAWVNHADRQALGWLGSRENFPWKDLALAAAARSLSATDPTQAAGLVEKIQQCPDAVRSSLEDTIQAIQRELPNAVPASVTARLFPPRR